MPRASGALSAHYHFAAMVFAQLTYRESLQAIEAFLLGLRAAAYRMGIRGLVMRPNLAYANEHRDWRVFAEIACVLMRRAQRVFGETPPELGLEAGLFRLGRDCYRNEPGVFSVGALAEGADIGEVQRAAGDAQRSAGFRQRPRVESARGALARRDSGVSRMLL